MLVRRVWPSRPVFDNPMSDGEQLRREMLRLLGGQSGELLPHPDVGAFPPVNVTQDAENFYIRAEVPGIEVNELSVSAVRNRVSISGRRQIPQEHDRVSYHRKERAEGTFNRAFGLPAEVDAVRVTARCADGILTVKLPKAEETKPRKIEISS